MMACHRFVILRQIADAYHKELVYRATKMQAFYRGKRARMMTRIKMHNLRQKKLRLINNHKQCQRLCRGFSARRFTKRLRIETRKRRVKQAKSWRQVAEDPANPGIPIDPDTTLLTQDQQKIVWTSWRPEKRSKKNLLRDTDVKRCLHLEKVYGVSEFIMNPLLTMDAVDMVAFQEAKRCSECEERDASRLCDYCGDKFCAQCWPVVHDAGRHFPHVT